MHECLFLSCLLRLLSFVLVSQVSDRQTDRQSIASLAKLCPSDVRRRMITIFFGANRRTLSLSMIILRKKTLLDTTLRHSSVRPGQQRHRVIRLASPRSSKHARTHAPPVLFSAIVSHLSFIYPISQLLVIDFLLSSQCYISLVPVPNNIRLHIHLQYPHSHPTAISHPYSRHLSLSMFLSRKYHRYLFLDLFYDLSHIIVIITNERSHVILS